MRNPQKQKKIKNKSETKEIRKQIIQYKYIYGIYMHIYVYTYVQLSKVFDMRLYTTQEQLAKNGIIKFIL